MNERVGPDESDLDPRRPRIFGIGLNKTATSSLHEALVRLGFCSFHGGHDHGSAEALDRAVKEAAAAHRPLLSAADPRYDAFSDVGALSRRFRQLDQQYKGSRFVLTVRPVDQWISSRRRHVARNQKGLTAGEYSGSFLVVDEERWRAEWDHHLERVRSYFGERPDFVEMDLTAEPSWAPLCGLLGLPEPNEPFPWANRDVTAPHA